LSVNERIKKLQKKGKSGKKKGKKWQKKWKKTNPVEHLGCSSPERVGWEPVPQLGFGWLS